MRFSLPAFLAAALLTVSGTVFAQSSSIEISPNDIEVKLDASESPKISADNVSAPAGNSGIGAPKWIEINVVYTMPVRTDSRTRQMEWLDDMSIEAQVLLNPAEYEGKTVTALLTGKQVFWSIPCDGKKHKASLFVPPIVVGRYGKADIKTNKSFARDLAAMVVMKTKNQVVIGRGFQVPKTKKLADVVSAFQEVERSLGILKLPDIILPREQTPWAHLDYDAFDMPKLSGSK